MGIARWAAATTAVLVVGGLVAAGLRAHEGERSGPPAAAVRAVAAGTKSPATPTNARPTKNTTVGDPSTKRANNEKSNSPRTRTNKPTKKTQQQRTTSTRKGYWYRTGPNTSRRVALTFDDCPRSLAAFKKVVVGAERLGIGMMLFPTGVCVQSGRFSAPFARAHGHYVFNHSINHPDLAKLSYGSVLQQLSLPGVQSRYGRPPFGSYNAGVARAYAAKGMKIWTWSVDSLDWHGRSEQSVVRTAVHAPRAGGTVLMHMQWHGFSVSALRQMKAGLDKRGLGTCRNFPGTTPVRSWNVRC